MTGQVKNWRSDDAIDFPLDLAAFGARVFQARRWAGLSQAKLAVKCRIGRSYISGIEKGTQKPSMRTAEDIAVALAVSLDWLLAGVGKARLDASDEIDALIGSKRTGKRAEVILRRLKGIIPDIEELQILLAWRAVSPATQDAIRNILRGALAEKGMDWPDGTHKIVSIDSAREDSR